MGTLEITSVPVPREHSLRAGNNRCVPTQNSAVPVGGIPIRAQANRFLGKVTMPPLIDAVRVLYPATPPIPPL
jgi:hypothetical protein